MMATMKGRLDSVQALIDGGADINKKDPVSLSIHTLPKNNISHHAL